jgi:hypothetical protein
MVLSAAAVPADQRPSQARSRCAPATRAVKACLELWNSKMRHGPLRAACSKFFAPADRGGELLAAADAERIPGPGCVSEIRPTRSIAGDILLQVSLLGLSRGDLGRRPASAELFLGRVAVYPSSQSI